MRRSTPRRTDLRPHSTIIHRAAIEALEARQLLSAGFLDSSFGDGGIQNIATGAPYDTGGAAVQSTGKIIVLTGSTANEVQRLQVGGETDTTFGTNGFATLPNPGNGNGYTHITVEADDKIIAYGPNVIARLNANGSVDTTFDGGVITTPVGYLAVQANDAIAVSTGGAADTNPTIYRINGNGLRDGSFNNNTGSATLPLNTASPNSWVGGVGITPSQQIVVSVVQGETAPQAGETQTQYGVVRLLASGAVDTTFGTAGLALNSYGIDTYQTSAAKDDTPDQIAVGTDGIIYQLGDTVDGTGVYDYLIYSYSPTGETSGVGDVGNDAPNAGFTIQPNNEVVTFAATKSDYIALNCYQSGGALHLDSTFGYDAVYGAPDGKSNIVFEPVDNSDDWSNDVVVPESIVASPDGQLIIGSFFQGTVSNIQRIAAVDQGTDFGSVSGFVFADNNKSAAWDTNEPGIEGVTVYADLNNNGKLDPNEPSTTTNDAGQYTLNNVPAGDQIIREQTLPGASQTFPASNLGHHITVTPAGVTNVAFGLFMPNAIDTTYGTNGVATDNTSSSVIAVQGSDVIVLCQTQTTFYLQRLLPSGALDTSFGTNGSTAAIQFTGNGSVMAIGPGGNIIVSVGQILASFTANGATDTSFGGGTGHVTLPNNGSAVGIAFQSDGKILLSATDTGGPEIYRFTAAGALDSTYGSGGVASASTNLLSDEIIGQIVVNSSNQAIITMSGLPVAGPGSPAAVFALFRFTTSGTLDTSFGNNGMAIDGGQNDGLAPFNNALAIAPNGTLFQTNNYDPLQGDESDLSAYSANGQLLEHVYLPTLLSNTVGYSTDVDLTDLATQADDKLVAVGILDDGNGTPSAEVVMRFNPDLTLDSSFNGDGVALIHIAGAPPSGTPGGDVANAVSLQSNGDIFVGGSSSGVIYNLYGEDVAPTSVNENTIIRLIGGPIATPTATVSGTVYNDANKDGSQDNGETGVADWLLYIDQTNAGHYMSGDPTTTTDASGNYSFTVAAPGNEIIRVSAPANYTQITPANNLGHHVSVAAGQTVTGENFGFYLPVPGASILGVVTLTNGSVAPDGWTVYLDANNNSKLDSGEISTTTSGGIYTFSGLPAGSYIIRVIAPAGYTQVQPSSDYGHHVTVSSGQLIDSGENFDFRSIVGTAAVSGTIFNDANGNGLYDAGETGLAGWTLFIDLDDSYGYVAGDPTATTDANGDYTFSDLGAGDYIIRVEMPTAWVQTTPANNLGHHVTLANGQVISNEDFGEFKPTASPG